MERAALFGFAVILATACQASATGHSKASALVLSAVPPEGTEEPAQEPAGSGAPQDPEELPAPAPAEAKIDDDWIRLVSDEWLRGEIKVLRSGTLQFDSEELDDLTFDFDDIPEVRTSRPMTCVFEDDVVLTGPLLIRDDQVYVGTGTDRKNYPRVALVTLIPGAQREKNYWSGQIGFGLDLRSGNTEQEDFTFNFSATRRSPYTRLDLAFNSVVTTVNSVDTANNQRGTLKYDYFLSRRTYLTPFWLQYFRDPFQNIGQRWSPGLGAGYYFFDQPGLQWTGDIGGGYQFTKLDSVAAGEDDTDAVAFGRVGTFLDADITSRTDIEFDYSLLVPFEDADSYNQHLKLVISTDLWADLDLDVSFTWDRQGDPEDDSAGVTPEQDDYRTTVGFSWEF